MSYNNIVQMSENYYDILGVPKSANKQQIKKAYKKLAIKHHPDKNLNDVENAKKRFIKISQAYATLSDDTKRAIYDNPPPPPPPQQNYSRPSQSGSTGFTWKNPEFNPNFNHFNFNQQQFVPPNWQKQTQGPMPNFQNYQIPIFKTFSNINTFKTFQKSNYEFGSFTFQMAQEIFRNVFQQMPKQIQSNGMTNNFNQLSLHKTYSMPEKRDPYQPQNSTILSQKTVERNGKTILIRKYSVNENGKINKYTHQTVLR